MISISTEILPLFLSILFVSLVVLWVAIANRKNWLMLFFIIPLTLTADLVAYMTVNRIFGYPVTIELPDNSIYVSHLESYDREFIHVWVIEPNSTRPRAIDIANTEQNQKQLEEAKEKSDNGVMQTIERDGTKSNSNDIYSDGVEYIVYDFVPSETYQK